MKKKRHQILKIIGIFSIGIIICTLLFITQQPKVGETKREKTWQVQAKPLIKGNYQPTAVIYGVVSSFRKTTLRSALNAEVEQVNVKEGTTVVAGQILASLDKQFYQLDVNEKKADIARLDAQIKSEKIQNQIDLETISQDKKLIALSLKMRQRYTDLKKNNLSSQAQVDDADKTYVNHLISLKKTEIKVKNHQNKMAILQANLVKAKAKLDKAVLDLEDATIRAPFTGKVTDVYISKGDRLIVNSPMVSLYSSNSLEIRAQLSEHLRQVFTQSLANKQPIFAEISSKIKLKLARVESEVEDGDSNVDAFFSIPIEDVKSFPLGLTVSLKVYLPSINNVYRIPQVALYHGNTIYLIINNRLQQVKVNKIGQSNDDDNNSFYLVSLPEKYNGKQVLLTKIPFVRDGLKVKVLS